MNENPNYYGILPANVRYAKNVCSSAKLLFTELSALTNKEGYCFASNSYFAKLYDVSEKSISNWIKELDEAGFIKSEVTKNNSGTYRKIFLTDVNNFPTGQKKTSIGGEKKTSNGLEKNFHTKEYYNNNNININTNKENNAKANKDEIEIDVFPFNFSFNLIEAINRFFVYRKEIKKPLKNISKLTKIKEFEKQVAEHGESAVIQSIETAISNGYQGTFIKTNNNKNNGTNNAKQELTNFIRNTAFGIDVDKLGY